MKKQIHFSKEQGKALEANIHYISTRKGFDDLIEYLQNNFDAKVLEKYDVPGSRRWILQSDDQIFELVFDDGYGNYLIAPTKASEKLIYEIGEAVEKRLQDDN